MNRVTARRHPAKSSASDMEREASLSDRYERPQDFDDDAEQILMGGCDRCAQEVESSGERVFWCALLVVGLVIGILIGVRLS